MTSHKRPSRRRVLAGAAAAAATTTLAMPAIVRAQGKGPLKVGVLLPRSGFEAAIGQDCQRGVDIAPPILKSLGLPDLSIMNGDTESNVDVAREHAEKLISDGAQLLVGAFDSGQTTSIAQVAEQKGIPLVINIAGAAPKSAVFMRVNDTYGTAMSKGVAALMPKFDMPYKIADEISYDPAARDLSVEVSKAKATNAEVLLIVGRLNDAMLITKELIKQRWTPQAILSMGPGWYEDQYIKTLKKMADGPISFVPWYDPHKKLAQTLEAAFTKAYPDSNLNTNQVFTFEALLVAADAYKRAGSTDPKALADALRSTNITDNVSVGPGIQFDAKGQNAGVKDSAIQNRGGKLVTIAPKEAANAKPEWPMKSYQNRA